MKNLNGIALGTFPFANVFGTIKENSAAEILKQYIEYGGEFIHVSLVYNNGAVEEFLGRELKKYPRSSYKIMACSGWHVENGMSRLSGKKEDVEKCCNSVLKRLQLDYIDVLMSHGPDISTPYEETIDAMVEQKKRGKCQKLCVSNVTLDMLRRYNYSGQVDYIQNRFSLLNQSLHKELVDYCLQNNIKITTYQSIERGLLTDKVLNEFVLHDTDLRNKKPEFSCLVRSEIAHWVRECLAPIAEKEKLSITTLVLCWTLQNQPVSAVLCGISKNDYFNDCLIAAKTKLSDNTLLCINDAFAKFSEYIANKYVKSVVEFMGI